MKEALCINCSRNFPASPRHKNQTHCQRPQCQRARKAAWQRHKMQTDPEYMANQKLSNRQWRQSNPDYWKQYRENNPDKAHRNKMLQRLRNRKKSSAKSTDIAKMDASELANIPKFKSMGQYWLVPVIAKMDALKVNMVAISNDYG